jgi:hypothetical protein
MQLIATIEDPVVIQRILAHLGPPGTRDDPQPPWSMTDNRFMLSTLDTVITIPNERQLNAAPKGTCFQESFKMVDDVLLQAVRAISDIITVPGLINVDFADVKAIMEGMGIALMGTGSATGDTRALEATHRDISSPLFEEASADPLRREDINVPAFIRKKAGWPLASTILRYTPLAVGQQAAVRR